jgi:hypothetical protein
VQKVVPAGFQTFFVYIEVGRGGFMMANSKSNHQKCVFVSLLLFNTTGIVLIENDY